MITEEELYATTDAAMWAEAFMQRAEALGIIGVIDEGWMIGWFANAIETSARHERGYF